MSLKLKTTYANQYNGGGENALIDGIKGTKDFRTGSWQGYQDKDVVAIVNLGEEKTINIISVNFLEDQRSWIFYPTVVECYASNDNNNYKFIGNYNIDASKYSDGSTIKTIDFKMPSNSYQYIKIVARKLGKLPKWHLGYKHDGRSWIFIDEISIKQ